MMVTTFVRLIRAAIDDEHYTRLKILSTRRAEPLAILVGRVLSEHVDRHEPAREPRRSRA